MLLITEEQRHSLENEHRLQRRDGQETLVGLTFEESVFYLSFIDLSSRSELMNTRSADHFRVLTQRHQQALAANQNADDSDVYIPTLTAL
jgi:hypothetical protein